MATKSYGNGIFICRHCGEIFGTKAIFCKTCKTQDQRKKIFDENVAIAKENKAKGYTVPDKFPNWK